jgi:transposase
MVLHANAALSLRKRVLLCERVVEQEWTLTKAAAGAEVSVRTARKWARRYRADGEAGLADRSSTPARQPTRTSEDRVQAIAALRRLRMTAAEIAALLSMPLLTVSGMLTRIGLGKLRRSPRRRESQHRDRLPAPRAGLLRRARDHRAAPDDRQRPRLRRTGAHARLPRAGPARPAHAARPTTHQRQESNASSARCSPAGPTAPSTPAPSNEPPRSPSGLTTTTTGDPTARSATTRRQPASRS